MNRLVVLLVAGGTFLIGCDKPNTQLQHSPQPSNATPAYATNAPLTNTAATESAKQAIPHISDVFKSQLVKLIEETTKLDQMFAQGIASTDTKPLLPGAKTSLELTRLTWPEGIATNALSGFADAIRAWELAIDLRERIPKLNAEQKRTLGPGHNYSEEEAVTLLQAAETSYNPNDLPSDYNGYQEISAFGKESLVYSVYPDDYRMKAYRGKTFLPLSENIKALEQIASRRLKIAREEVITLLK